MSKSNIEWTGFTWNPIAGCTVLTPGCKRCYAMKMAARLERMGQELYAGLTKPSNAGPVWTGIVRKAPEHILLGPLKRKKPTTYFVNSMSDLFHEDVPEVWIDEIFDVMARTPHHTYQVLTKRADRMQAYCSKPGKHEQIFARVFNADETGKLVKVRWPLPNVWLGVSTERQKEADERIPLLLQTPAAIRFVSAEPLLGPIDLRRIAVPDAKGVIGHTNALKAHPQYPWPTLDWVIVGGESGALNQVRRFDLAWARSILGQCKTAGVACFIKQMGADPVDSSLVAEGDGPSVKFKDKKGGDPNEWPEDLRVREMPTPRMAEAA